VALEAGQQPVELLEMPLCRQAVTALQVLQALALAVAAARTVTVALPAQGVMVDCHQAAAAEVEAAVPALVPEKVAMVAVAKFVFGGLCNESSSC
jgi:hypothetical protein